MKKYIMLRTIATCIAAVGCIFQCFAQYAEDEELSYEPIHSTLIPSTLNVEESYTKNYTVSFSGDDIVFTVLKPMSVFSKSDNNIPKIDFKLPVNPRQDYEMEFKFTCSDLKKSSVAIALGYLHVAVGAKNYIISNVSDISNVNEGNFVTNPKKWSLPVGETKESLSIKIERRKNIITIYANGLYLAELKDSKNILREMPVCVTFASYKKKSSAYLNSIKVDQGGVNKDE